MLLVVYPQLLKDWGCVDNEKDLRVWVLLDQMSVTEFIDSYNTGIMQSKDQ